MRRFCNQPTYPSYCPAGSPPSGFRRDMAAAAAMIRMVPGVALVVVLLLRLSRVEVFRHQYLVGGGSPSDK